MASEATLVETAASVLDEEVENLGAEAKHNSNSSVNADASDSDVNGGDEGIGAEEEEERRREGEETNEPIFRHPAELLTEEEVLTLEGLFKQMTNDDGILRPKQLVEAMKQVGAEVEEETLRRQLKMGDGEDEGIDIEDFIHMMAIHMKRKLSEDDVQLAFSSFDLNQDGFIDKDELTAAMRHIGFHLEPEEIEEMILDADKDGDGKISFEEFKEKMLIFGGNMTCSEEETSPETSAETSPETTPETKVETTATTATEEAGGDE